MTNGPVIGAMKKGPIIPHPHMEPREGETPSRTKPAGAVPRGQQHDREDHKVVGANPRKAH